MSPQDLARKPLEPADLLIQLGLDDLGVGLDRLDSVGEDSLGPLEEVLLPGVDESGVDGELAGQLVDGLVSLEGNQGNLGLQWLESVLPRPTECLLVF